MIGRRLRAWPCWTTAIMLSLFVTSQISTHLYSSGDDLSATYIGCRLLAGGQAGELYAHDPEHFDLVWSGTWEQAAKKGHFEGFLHPYVQTPLWAYLLQPACTSLTFGKFNALFVALAILAIAGTIWIVARRWAPEFLRPNWMAAAILLLVASTPFQYAMALTQTHSLFIFLTVAALMLAHRQRHLAAGAFLAVAASVKVTPALIVIYWVAKGHTNAVVAFFVFVVAALVLTLLAVGWATTCAYISELQRVSNILLVSFNNQSLAAAWSATAYPADELFNWRIFPLPPLVKTTSMVVCVLLLLAAGWMDRQTKSPPTEDHFGAGIALVAITLFSPIAWTHYFIVLVVPIMLLARTAQMPQMRWMWIGVVVVTLLNILPFTYAAEQMAALPLTVPRGHFLSGVLAIILLTAAGMRARAARRQTVIPPAATRQTWQA